MMLFALIWMLAPAGSAGADRGRKVPQVQGVGEEKKVSIIIPTKYEEDFMVTTLKYIHVCYLPCSFINIDIVTLTLELKVSEE